MLLSLGAGFTPTPNNINKEEETLILEGFRVTSRIGKLDSRINSVAKPKLVKSSHSLDTAYSNSSTENISKTGVT